MSLLQNARKEERKKGESTLRLKIVPLGTEERELLGKTLELLANGLEGVVYACLTRRLGRLRALWLERAVL